MARTKKRKKTHGTPKANHQRKQPKRQQDRKQQHFDDPRALARQVTAAPKKDETPDTLTKEGVDTMVDLFGSLYNTMHAVKEA